MNEVIRYALQTLDAAIGSVRLDTAWGPPVVLQSPFAPGSQKAAEGGPPAVVAGALDVRRVLRPKLTLVMRPGYGENVSFAPYGDPGASKWPIVATGLAVIALLGIAAITRRRG